MRIFWMSSSRSSHSIILGMEVNGIFRQFTNLKSIFHENIPLLHSTKDLGPRKHMGEKTTRFSKTIQPIRFVDSSDWAQISSE